jgi:hypothetical protein
MSPPLPHLLPGYGSRFIDGDRPTNRYYLFSITVELGKKLKYANYGSYQKRCETVYVKELV